MSLSGAGDVPSVQRDAGQSPGRASSCRAALCSRGRSCAAAGNTPASASHVVRIIVPRVYPRATFPPQCQLINLLSYTLLSLGLAPEPQREESTCQKVSVSNEREVRMETPQLSHSSCDRRDAIASTPLPVTGRDILGGQRM